MQPFLRRWRPFRKGWDSWKGCKPKAKGLASGPNCALRQVKEENGFGRGTVENTYVTLGSQCLSQEDQGYKTFLGLPRENLSEVNKWGGR